ncbi:tripartite ATP-independent transporter DctP family solute receptor [Geomicrobium halophilum]|uniref:Tripartite ATP-independent transporter DctP family solute receptor n=1 Tax=Geomicrobium halophilum TaxID=549000 RepID=A0A841PIZ2_9BACL|nr:C4-dicarboxylate TRAP transporter substrate-binding protein [Geomicrobium halophilum]MBB6448699.1 tripartite ATP-independent transporter DctP family solute receptor [Geomicrobium halophilum]
MKKNWGIKGVLFIMLVNLLAACGNGSAEGGASSNGEEVYEISLAHGNQPGEPVAEVAENWTELAEEKSDGRLELTVYPSSQLGAEGEVVEQAMAGNNVIIMTGYDYLMDYVEDFGILTAPYLTEDFEELIYLTTTDWFDGLHDDLKDQGLEIVATNNVYGERHLMTNGEVLTPDDLNGMIIRTPDNNMAIQSFEAMGASPTALSLDELYTSLQQGVVDGAENPIPVLEGTNAHEVTNYLALTGHQKFITPWVSGTTFMETLPEDLKTILQETGEEAMADSEHLVEEAEVEILEMFEEEGITINEVDQEPFEEEAMTLYDITDQWSEDLYEQVQQLLEER